MGRKVTTNASYLTHDALRIFGSVWKSKKVLGKVIRLDKRKPIRSTRNVTFITCDWTFPRCVITKELNRRLIKYIPPGEDIVHVAAVAPDATIDTTAHPHSNIVPNTGTSTAQADQPPLTPQPPPQGPPPVEIHDIAGVRPVIGDPALVPPQPPIVPTIPPLLPPPPTEPKDLVPAPKSCSTEAH